MTVALLVAYSKNRIIGAHGAIPWNLPCERNRFKAICNGKIIIMGRKSFDEIGHALPYCTIMIISKKMKTAPEGCLLGHSLEEAFKQLQNKQSDENKEILVAGGSSIYQQAMPYASKIYATEILENYDGDSFFPQLEGLWEKEIESEHLENEIKYRYVTFTRKEHL